MIFRPYYCSICKHTLFLDETFDDEVESLWCPYCGAHETEILFFNPEIFRFGPSDKIEDVEGIKIEYE